jgi:hypothetical protein
MSIHAREQRRLEQRPGQIDGLGGIDSRMVQDDAGAEFVVVFGGVGVSALTR